MRALKLTIAYDGTRFVGWQRQAQGESVQGLLEAALAPLEGGSVTVHGAGRTDAGVHAIGQVASVVLACLHPVTTIVRAVNAQLPEDVRVVDAAEVPVDFHARFSAKGKTYRYAIANETVANPFLARFVWRVPERLDLDAMNAGAAALLGTHDFAAFQSAGSDVATTTRTLTRSDVRVEEMMFPSVRDTRVLVYEVSGDGFLRHMVRAIVGTLVDAGRGRRDPRSMGDLVVRGTRAAAGPTAPPQGLFLIRVDY